MERAISWGAGVSYFGGAGANLQIRDLSIMLSLRLHGLAEPSND